MSNLGTQHFIGEGDLLEKKERIVQNLVDKADFPIKNIFYPTSNPSLQPLPLMIKMVGAEGAETFAFLSS